MSKRGLLIPCPVLLAERGPAGGRLDFFPSSEIPIATAWQWLLLWDELALPRFRGETFPCTDGFLSLQEAGALSRVDVDVPNQAASRTEALGIVQDAHARAYRQLDEAGEAIWVSGWPHVEASDAHVGSRSGRAALFRFCEALPSPGPGTRLHDVLSFRERRVDLRRRLLAEIDRLYLTVLDSKDHCVALDVAVRSLALAVDDYRRVGREAGFTGRLAGFELKIDLGTALGALATFLAAHVSPMLATFLGGMTLERKIGAAGRVQTSPYEYAALVARELS